MILVIDVGNTHTHVALADANRLRPACDFDTPEWARGGMGRRLDGLVRGRRLEGVCFCSVVPKAAEPLRQWVRSALGLEPLQLTPSTLRGITIDYPKPETIGQDRLANAMAALHWVGAPCLVIGFGTAVTFDVVRADGAYVGGMIAPGLAAMTEYLHEKTAQLPLVTIREPRSAIGRNTEEAMLAGAVYGYRGLVRELIGEVKRELKARRLRVVATGGYAGLMAKEVREIDAVMPSLALEGLRLLWYAHQAERGRLAAAPGVDTRPVVRRASGSRSPRQR